MNMMRTKCQAESIHNLLRIIRGFLGIICYVIPVVHAAEQRAECPEDPPMTCDLCARRRVAELCGSARAHLNAAGVLNVPPDDMVPLPLTAVGRANEDVSTDMRPGNDGT